MRTRQKPADSSRVAAKSGKVGPDRAEVPAAPETLLSGVEAADRLGISPKWLRELAKRELLPRAGERYPWPAVRDDYHSYLEAKAEDRLGPGNVKVERAALLRVQRHLAELELAELRGELVRIATVAEEYGGILGRIRAKLFNAPGKYAPRIVGIGTPGEARSVLEELIRELLEELRSVHVPDGKRRRKRVMRGRSPALG